MKMGQTSVGILTIATNPVYVGYWASMAKSIGNKFGSGISLTLHVFTDLPRDAQIATKSIHNLKIKSHKIDSLGWPDATQRRYEIIYDHREALGEDVLMHLDADMLFRSSVPSYLVQLALRRNLVFVKHPGYYRPAFSLRTWKYYVERPSRLRDDLDMVRLRGRLGDWEDRKASRAYVAKEDRRDYVCGGCWLGTRDSILALCRELAEDTILDQRIGLQAKWHDESYLNRFYAKNPYPSVGPAYCYDSRLSFLDGIRPVIEAVDKGSRKIR